MSTKDKAKAFVFACIGFLTLAGMSPVAVARTTFYEDFDDGTAEGFTPLSEDWQVIAGQYNCLVIGYELEGLSVFGDENWADYELDLDVMVKGAPNHGVIFRMQSAEDYYRLGYRADPFNEVRLNRIRGGVREVLLVIPVVPNYVGMWYHLRIVVDGQNISAYLDGIQIFTYYDATDPLLHGYCGLSAWSGGGLQMQDAYFDNVQVNVFVVGVEQTTWGAMKQLYR